MCPIARSLDVLGERWVLLIVRELLLGPKRFKELLARLPAMGTNRLAERLRGLEADGVVAKRRLPPPADVPVYELTPLGERLRPLILSLGSWGGELPPDERVDVSSARAELVALGLAGTRPAAASAGLQETYEFRVGPELFHIVVDDGRVTPRSGPALAAADLVVECDLPTFMALASGQLSASKATDEGRARVTGPRSLLVRAFKVLGDRSLART
jgi:DNA-binding HxlR family transcriptional regulator